MGNGHVSDSMNALDTGIVKGLKVVVGAANPLGRSVVDKLASNATDVRAVIVDPSRKGTPFPNGVDVVIANPLKPHEVSEACSGARFVYDCFEPSQTDRSRLMTEATSNVLSASIDEGSGLALASHLVLSLTENDSAEKDVINANHSRLIETVVMRIPQLYGPRVVNGLWKGIFEAAKSNKTAHWMGDPDVPRSFLYVDDAAIAMILLSGSLLAHGRVWNVSGPGPLSGREFVNLAFQAARKEPKMSSWGRGIMITGQLLASSAKEYMKLPYNYYESFVMNDSEFTDSFPSWHYASHEEAIRKTYDWYSKFSP